MFGNHVAGQIGCIMVLHRNVGHSGGGESGSKAARFGDDRRRTLDQEHRRTALAELRLICWPEEESDRRCFRQVKRQGRTNSSKLENRILKQNTAKFDEIEFKLFRTQSTGFGKQKVRSNPHEQQIE